MAAAWEDVARKGGRVSGELKHTPGPWVRDVSHGADWGWIRDGEGRMVAVCGIPEGEDLLCDVCLFVLFYVSN